MTKKLAAQTRKESPIENILASYLDERSITLTPAEEELKERYEVCYNMMIDKHSLLGTVKKMMRKYNISQATVYRDMQAAELIFGSVRKFDKDAWRFIQIERKRRLIKKAEKAGEYEVAARLERDIDRLIDFSAEDPKFNPDKLKNLEITVQISKPIESALMKVISKGVVDFNEFEAEDIPHEDVTDGKED